MWELETLNLDWYGLEAQKIHSCVVAEYKLSLKAQFEINDVKRGLSNIYIYKVQKYINLCEK